MAAQLLVMVALVALAYSPARLVEAQLAPDAQARATDIFNFIVRPSIMRGHLQLHSPHVPASVTLVS